MKDMNLHAVAILKFNDYKNHNYPTIEFQDIATKSIFNVYFINERSGFYNTIQIGDTVVKETGKLEIISSNQKIKSPLQYDCEDKN